MLLVVALGGNALLKRGESLDAKNQLENVKIAAQSIGALIKAGHQVVICHGNGPQVGLLALQSEAYKKVEAYPFDVLNAESQSMIGYMLQQAIQNEIGTDSAVTLVTQVVVDADDKAFSKPTKFIGPEYPKDQAETLTKTHHWTMAYDGNYVRRVVASPTPKVIVELSAIEILIKKNITVICGGGGGIPVIKKDNQYVGVEAVIDKDMTSALIAEKIKADKLIILTDVKGIYAHWGKPTQRLIKSASPQQLDQLSFAAGSMKPKVKAVTSFVNKTHREAIIGSLTDLAAMLEYTSGTKISFPTSSSRAKPRDP